MELIGHRGLIDNTICENTLDSIKNALKHGLKIIEIDLRKTQDGMIVLHHDPCFEVNGKSYYISKNELKALQKLKKIATLNKALKACKGRAKIFLDVKVTDIEKEILRIVKLQKMESSVVIDPFIPEVMKRFIKLAPKIRRAAAFIDTYWKGILWWPAYTFFFPRIAKKYNARYIDVPAIFATKEFIDECHRFGLKITPFHFTSNEQLKNAIRNGADYIMIDTVEQLEFCRSMKNKE